MEPPPLRQAPADDILHLLTDVVPKVFAHFLGDAWLQFVDLFLPVRPPFKWLEIDLRRQQHGSNIHLAWFTTQTAIKLSS